MPREYGKNWFSMWTDEHFCTGRLFDKLFYQVLFGDRATNAAGIVPINFRKWRKALRDGERMPTERDLKASLVRLERRRYVFTDEDTGEVLIRSLIRRDEVWKQPNVMLSALRHAQVVDSGKFAAVLLSELDRIVLPEIKGDSPTANKLRDNLKRASAATRTRLQSLSEGLPEPFPEPFTEDFPQGLPEPFPQGLSEPFPEGFRRPGETEPFPEGFPEGFTEPSVVVDVAVASPSGGTQVGERGGEQPNGHPGTTPAGDEPPSPFCDKHPTGTEARCGACGARRRARQAWDEQHATDLARAAQARRAAFWRDVEDCPDCDERGYLETDDGLARCPRHPWDNG